MSMNVNAMNSSREEIREKLFKSITSHYLTLISIIQGIVLGYGISILDLHQGKFGQGEWLLMVTTFITVISVWDEYQLGCAVYEWIPGIRDSIIPFFVGVSELLMIRSINVSSRLWYFYAAIFCCCALAAFINQYWSSGNIEKNKPILNVVGYFKIFNYIFCSIGILLFFLFWLIYSKDYDLIFSVIALIMILSFLIRGRIIRSRIMKYALSNTHET